MCWAHRRISTKAALGKTQVEICSGGGAGRAEGRTKTMRVCGPQEDAGS